MAKQSSQKDKALKKNMTKLIVPVKSENGAYAFKEQIILAEKLNEALAKKRV